MLSIFQSSYTANLPYSLHNQAFNLSNKQIIQVLTRPGSSPAFFKYNPTIAPAIQIMKEMWSPIWWTMEAGATI